MSWQVFRQLGLVRQVNLTFIGLCVLSLFLCLWCLFKLVTVTPPGPLLPAEDSLLPLVVNTEALNELPGIIALRPLFWRSRKPFEATEIPEVKLQTISNLDKVKVVGVYSAGVIVRGVKGKGRVATGSEVLGWTLHRVGLGFAVFVKAGKEKKLPLQGPSLKDPNNLSS